MAGLINVPQEISKGSAHITSKLNHKFDRTTNMMLINYIYLKIL